MKKLDFKELTIRDIIRSQNSLVLTQKIANNHKGLLKDTIILHINHTFNDVFAFNEILTKTLGAELYFISIPYNNTLATNVDYFYLKSIRKGVEFLGYLDNNLATPLIKKSDLVQYVVEAIAYVMLHIKDKLGNKKLVVMQDGGYTVSMDDPRKKTDFFGNLPNFVGMIEQTQSGVDLFKWSNSIYPLKYPVVTIARSHTKVRMESEFIAQRIFEELNYLIYAFGEFVRFKTVIVGGYGIIGRKLSHYLRANHVEVWVYDIDPVMRRLAKREGYTTLNHIHTQDLIESFCYIGATGKQSFGIAELEKFLRSKKSTYVLASGSSKRTEFLELIYFFELGSSKEYRQELLDKHPILREIKNIEIDVESFGFVYKFTYKNAERKLYLLAEGFPVNMFDKECDSVPDRAIDPIQCLMMESLFSLVMGKITNPGIHYISHDDFNKISGINEEDLLREWCKLNGINLISESPYTLFPQHPLEQYLTKKKYEK